MTFTFRTVEEAVAGLGRPVGPSGWIAVDQTRIDRFAEATGDFQWIHVDPVRAAAGPFGGTVAHGYLTLSLINMVLPDLILPENMDWGVNYGCNKVRFPSPVPVGSRLRVAGTVTAVEPLDPRTVQVTLALAVEIEGKAKPACVAEVVSRYAFKEHVA